ncbi:MAG: response regulator [Bacteroidia bacterium]|nr:response regulator [Bacteroidia bacterium]MBP7261266.1 response regulator [Bacteroidia bacterium]MBP9180407.1 response regulator [Bacteroidia bacterium]MBP9725095.1 response regulator [Bacteroidia bacterium]
MKRIKTLCLVDDDDIFQLITQRVIAQTNLVDTIKVFSNGLDAMDFLRSVAQNAAQLPEIILLDLNMPVMDGWEFLEEFTLLKPRLEKKITIYVVSSSIAPSDIQRAEAINEVTDYIIKPITTEKLLDMLKNL